jgi:single-strand DNA-binding protein
MQNITISGRLGRDAELRTTQQGDSVCGFTVAVDVRQGREKITNWWRVSIWGKRGEALNQYLVKGASVTVIGEFSLAEYDGKPQLNIRANEIALQGGRSDGGQPAQRDAQPQRKSGDGSRGHAGAFSGDDLDDDIPFISSLGIW